MKRIELVDPSEIVAGCIEVYDSVITNHKELIDLAESLNNWQESGIYSDADALEPKINKEIRSSVALPLNQFSYEVEQDFYDMCKVVWHYCDRYAQKNKVSFYSTEPAQILKYSPGQHYDAHIDSGTNVPRVISALLYLNDVEEGGETEFVKFDINIKPRAGRLVIFPSNYPYEHAAKPPKSGNKYVAVFWMRG